MFHQLPEALIAAREDEALTHGQVCYGLIKPTKDMDQVESTAAMVNVIPKKRIYRMEKQDEIDLFMAELMKRPLVLQPSAHIGRGLAMIGCSMCTREERWVMIVNQAHPKIKSRIQMGINTAKAKMDRGEPFVLQFSFNNFLKRVYIESLTKAALDARFTFIDFEDAEIVIRYPGDFAHRGMRWEMQSPDITFAFEDLLPSDISRRTVNKAQMEWKNPALRVIMPEELNQLLKGWEFEQEDPLAGVIPLEEEIEGAVGGFEVSQETDPMVPSSGKIVGRAKRKANNSNGAKFQIPVELHIPEDGGPQILHQGNKSPSAPYQGGQVSPSRPYENLDRRSHANEHAYEASHIRGMNPPRSPHGMDSPYEEYNVKRHNQPASYQRSTPQYMANTPRTPTAPRMSDSPNTYLAPRTPTSAPRTPTSPARTPTSAPHTPTSPARTPTTPRYNPDVNTYNSEREVSSETRPSHTTYLTDDDGGFSVQNPRSQQHSSNKYDTNYNRSAEVDRYGNPVIANRGHYDPSDRYGSQQQPSNFSNSEALPSQRPYNLGIASERPTPSPRGNFPPSSRQNASPMGFHHHQGSGRSDTSASDSGFGDNENGHESNKYRNGKTNSYGNGLLAPAKAPYYNRAFEQDSPEKESVVDDIMAAHKALAAKMVAQQGPGVPNSQSQNRQNYYNDGNYGQELQKWRRNINDLEDACDVPDVDFSKSKLQVNSGGHQGQEQMEESFI